MPHRFVDSEKESQEKIERMAARNPRTLADKFVIDVVMDPKHLKSGTWISHDDLPQPEHWIRTPGHRFIHGDLHEAKRWEFEDGSAIVAQRMCRNVVGLGIHSTRMEEARRMVNIEADRQGLEDDDVRRKFLSYFIKFQPVGWLVPEGYDLPDDGSLH